MLLGKALPREEILGGDVVSEFKDSPRSEGSVLDRRNSQPGVWQV